jgi:Fe-S-cluster-containing dehydrogenase component
MGEDVKVKLPGRWDTPFGEDMTEEIVSEILKISPFCDIDQKKFPARIPLSGILLNDTKVNKYKTGDIIVREGDYGNSAFFILKGNVRVVVEEKSKGLPDSMLGRSAPVTKNWLSALAQLWSNSKINEFRKTTIGAKKDTSSGVGVRTDGDTTRVFLQDVPGVISNYNTIIIEQGEFFGEIAALGRTPRTSSIFSNGDDVELLEIKWQGLRDIRRFTPSIKDHIDRLYRERSLETHLKETPYLSHLSAEQLKKVAEETQFRSYGEFDWYTSFKKLAESSNEDKLKNEPLIFQKGDYPNNLVLVRSGFGRMSKPRGNGEKTLSYIGKGQDYGLGEIAHNWRSEEQITYQYNFRAIGHIDVLIIPANIVEELILPNLPKELMPPLIRNGKRKTDSAQTKEKEDSQAELVAKRSDDVLSSSDLEFLVENRYINGQSTMVINLNRCTRCDDCVTACSVAHDGNPRFIRQGKSQGALMVANACMHCLDPICMIGCPTGAISRETTVLGEVVINASTCVGCQTCANSCPYENISMVDIRSDNGQVILDERTHKPIIQATKCDLCFEQIGGPSCERSCPHDALIRVDMRDEKKLAKWLSR